MQKECYVDNIRYFYTYTFDGFVTKSDCSIHGHGFFKTVIVKIVKITLENVCVCVCVCVNTAYNESNSQTYVNYAHLNHFQNKLDLKLSAEGNRGRGN